MMMAGENALAALQGLRGVSALHLLLYHSLSRTKWPTGWLVDLQVDKQTPHGNNFVFSSREGF